jgi:hypothetical protein
MCLPVSQMKATGIFSTTKLMAKDIKLLMEYQETLRNWLFQTTKIPSEPKSLLFILKMGK